MENAARTPLCASILLCHPPRHLDAAGNHLVTQYLPWNWRPIESLPNLSIQTSFSAKKGNSDLANRDPLWVGHLSSPIFSSRPHCPVGRVHQHLETLRRGSHLCLGNGNIDCSANENNQYINPDKEMDECLLDPVLYGLAGHDPDLFH